MKQFINHMEEEMAAAFEKAGEYKDASEQIAATWYAEGEAKRTAQDWDGARKAFENAGELAFAKTLHDGGHVVGTGHLKHADDFGVDACLKKVAAGRVLHIGVLLAEDGKDAVGLVAHLLHQVDAAGSAHQHGGDDAGEHHHVACGKDRDGVVCP